MIKVSNLLKVVLALSFTLGAQTTIAKSKWYHIEVVVFDQGRNASKQSEVWPIHPGFPDTQNANALKTAMEEPSLQTATLDASIGAQSSIDTPLKENLTLIDDEDYLLQDATKRLKSKINARILIHKAWRQEIAPGDTPLPVHLFGGQQINAMQRRDEYSLPENIDFHEVDGIIKIKQTRFMHVDTDLLFHKPMKVVDKQAGDDDDDDTERLVPLRSQRHWKQSTLQQLKNFRLVRSEKIIANEVLFIDHPYFGVLVMIKPEPKIQKKQKKSIL